MSNKKPFKVYFDLNGNLLYRLYRYDSPTSYKEEDNHVFKDRLEYDDYLGSHISFKSLTSGRKYHMFLTDFHKMMLAKMMHENVIEGEFTFTKRGRVQGFKMLLPKQSD